MSSSLSIDDLNIDMPDDPDILCPVDYDITDICFGKGHQTELQLLAKMGKLQTVHTRNVLKKQVLQEDHKSLEAIEEEEKKNNEAFIKLRDLYNEETNFG